MKFPHKNVSIPDIHLGHDNTPAEDIIQRLLSMLTDDFLRDKDILYIPGDMFDKAIIMSNAQAKYVILCIHAILERCLRNNVKVRLLRGTPYHDARQGEIVQEMAQQVFPALDFRYVDDMIIEYIEDFDIHVMYVPDEWDTREKIYLKARSLLEEHQLDQVDFIIGHNQFSYQFNETLHDRVSTLNEDDWNKMVRYTAYFGHIHKPSICGKIAFAGSFDRLAHGEEHPKGFYEGIYRNEHDWELIHHENKEAQLYLTYELPNHEESFDLTTYTAMISKKLDSIYQKHPFVRFRVMRSPFAIREFIDQLRPRYPEIQFTWILDGKDDKEKKTKPLVDQTQRYHAMNITRDNILDLFKASLTDQDDESALVSLLEQCLQDMNRK